MDHKFKSKWESNNLIFDHKDYNNAYDEISWHQRNFMCNFCKKEYNSAQALGGHMNVHRRDRARLRLSSPSHHDDHHPPNPNPNPSPNPNPNFSLPPSSSSSSSMRCLPYKTCYHSCLFPLSSSPSSTTSKEGKQEMMMFPLVPHSARNFLGDMKKNVNYMEGYVGNVGNNGGFNGNSCVDQESEFRVWKKKESFGVEMEMGLLKDGKIGMDLDLELRLGRSESI